MRLVGSPEPLINNAIFKLFSFMPSWVCQLAWNNLAYHSTVSCSNMRTPSGRLTWGGASLNDVAFGVPVQGSIGIFCCIFSFNNRITFSVNCPATMMTREQLREFVAVRFNSALTNIVTHLNSSST